MRRIPVRRRPHPDVVLTLAALAAVALLLSLAYLLDAPLTPIAAMQEGARVAIEARVLDLRGRFAMLSDGEHRIGAFLPREALVEPGDLVRGEGVVSRGDDGLLLSLDELIVTLPTARAIREPAELAADPAAWDGARVTLAGIVRAPYVVGGGARVAMRGDAAPTEGDVLVTGTFRYHELDASYVLWVESWTPRS